MRVLVTGANGFLGRAVVHAFLSRGHKVRALVRPSRREGNAGLPGEVEIWPGDLRVQPDLHRAFEDVDVLIHLAAVVLGDDATHFASTIGGTERLLEGMKLSKTRRVILASSMSVYGWPESSRTLDEDTPPPNPIYEAGAYAVSKIWQERITRRMSKAHDWDLTVLRPGVVWGPTNASLGFVGPSVKRIQFVIGPGRLLPLTFVDNCADVFAKCAEDCRAVGQTFNVVDGHRVSAWRYASEISRRSGTSIRRIPVPYLAARMNAWLADSCRKILFKSGGKLPGLLRPRQLAYMRPLRFSNRKLVETLAWKPPIDFETALQRTFERDTERSKSPGTLQENCSRSNASGQQQ